MKNILFPTDFSESSQKRLDDALSYLRKEDQSCRVLLLHTYLIPPTPFHDLLKVHDALRQDSLQKLEKEIQRAQVPGSKASLEALSYLGTLENVISHLAGDQEIDLIIIGDQEPDLRRSLHALNQPILTPPFNPPRRERKPLR